VTLAANRSTLLLIDLQRRLMPSIAGGEAVVANARRLAEAARLLDVPVLATEQNPGGLGGNVQEIAALASRTLAKNFFDATREAAFETFLPAARLKVVVAGCETHVCVMQTVLGLLRQGRSVALVSDAVGSRTNAIATPRSPAPRPTAPSSSPPRWSSSNGSRRATTRASGRRCGW